MRSSSTGTGRSPSATRSCEVIQRVRRSGAARRARAAASAVDLTLHEEIALEFARDHGAARRGRSPGWSSTSRCATGCRELRRARTGRLVDLRRLPRADRARARARGRRARGAREPRRRAAPTAGACAWRDEAVCASCGEPCKRGSARRRAVRLRRRRLLRPLRGARGRARLRPRRPRALPRPSGAACRSSRRASVAADVDRALAVQRRRRAAAAAAAAGRRSSGAPGRARRSASGARGRPSRRSRRSAARRSSAPAPSTPSRRSRRSRRPRGRPGRARPWRAASCSDADRHQVARADDAGRRVAGASRRLAQRLPAALDGEVRVGDEAVRLEPAARSARRRARAPSRASAGSAPARRRSRSARGRARSGARVAISPAARSSTPTDGDVERAPSAPFTKTIRAPSLEEPRVVRVVAAQVRHLARDEDHPVDARGRAACGRSRPRGTRSRPCCRGSRRARSAARASPSPAASAGKIGFASSGTSRPITPVASVRARRDVEELAHRTLDALARLGAHGVARRSRPARRSRR